MSTRKEKRSKRTTLADYAPAYLYHNNTTENLFNLQWATNRAKQHWDTTLAFGQRVHTRYAVQRKSQRTERIRCAKLCRRYFAASEVKRNLRVTNCLFIEKPEPRCVSNGNHYERRMITRWLFAEFFPAYYNSRKT